MGTLLSDPLYKPGDELTCRKVRVVVTRAPRETKRGWVYEVRTTDHKHAFDVLEEELSTKPAPPPPRERIEGPRFSNV